MSNAPKVTEQDVLAAICKQPEYVVLPDGRTTICILTLDNGYTVRGESSCVSAENFNQSLGESYAYEDAKRKVWPLLGFRLADQIARDRRVAEYLAEMAPLCARGYESPQYGWSEPSE